MVTTLHGTTRIQRPLERAQKVELQDQKYNEKNSLCTKCFLVT